MLKVLLATVILAAATNAAALEIDMKALLMARFECLKPGVKPDLRKVTECSRQSDQRLLNAILSDDQRQTINSAYDAQLREFDRVDAGQIKLSDALATIEELDNKMLLDLGARLPEVEKPDWVKKPSGKVAWPYYPKKGLQAKLDGAVLLNCGIAMDGRMKDCFVISESPADHDFGAAALAASSEFEIHPWTVNGVPIPGGDVQVPVVFQRRLWGIFGPSKKDIEKAWVPPTPAGSEPSPPR